jgi:His/Glu/Gln/Arg/opine family amino acid ABC transporter permease subunit
MSLLGTYPWHWQVLWENGHLWYLLGGVKWTVILTASSFGSSLVLAVFVVLARTSRIAPLRWLAYVYVEFFRTVPLLLGILWVYYALPSLVPSLRLSAFEVAYLFFTLNLTAFVSEAFRAGLLGLSHGQRWAALSLGMTPWQMFYRILMPQSLRRVTPVLGSIWVSLFKDTSLVFVIGISEITYRSNRLGITTYRQLEIYTATTMLYFLLTWPQARAVDRLYERFRTHE